MFICCICSTASIHHLETKQERENPTHYLRQTSQTAKWWLNGAAWSHCQYYLCFSQPSSDRIAVSSYNARTVLYPSIQKSPLQIDGKVQCCCLRSEHLTRPLPQSTASGSSWLEKEMLAEAGPCSSDPAVQPPAKTERPFKAASLSAC